MEFFYLFLFLLALVSVAFYQWVALTRGKTFAEVKSEIEETPFVSLLVSIRNEEDNIEELCKGLSALNYPLDKLEVLIGDDGSEDKSVEMLRQLKPAFARLYQYQDTRCKADVLARLTTEAKGQVLLFTDADVSLNSEWINGMLAVQEVDMCIGVTAIQEQGWFDQLQNIDWLFNQSVIAWVNHQIGPVTAWGNNMSITRRSLDRIGGYGAIGSTLIEDVALMRKVTKAGGTVKIIASKDALLKSQPCPTWRNLIHQRSRWMLALRGMPWYGFLGLALRATFLPSLIVLAFFNPFALLLWPIKALLSYSITAYTARRVNVRISKWPFLLFDIYEFVLYLITFTHYLLNLKLDWKGRKY